MATAANLRRSLPFCGPKPQRWHRPLWALQRWVLSVGGRLGLSVRGALLRLARSLGPAELTLYEDAFAYLTSQTLYALVGSGALDELAAHGPATAAELSARCKLQEDILARLLRFAVTRDYVRLLHNRRFKLARGGRPLVRTATRSMAPFVRYAVSPATSRTGEQLERVLKGGGSGFVHAHGQSPWAYFAEHPEEGHTFDLAMRTHSARDVHHVARAIYSPAMRHVCDLGGGIGTLLASVLQHAPHARGTLVDRGGTLANAADFLAHEGVLARVTLAPGDFFAPLGVQADTFLLRNVLHDWDDAAVTKLLTQVRCAMRPGDRLCIVETLEGARPNRVTALSDVAMMLVSDSGKQRTRAQLDALLAGAQLRCSSVHALPQPMQLLQCVPMPS